MCSKCDENRRIGVSAELDGIETRETFSVTLNGEFLWFDVQKAKSVLGQKSCNVPNNRLVIVPVDEAWDNFVANCDITPEHLDHVDMTDPPILGSWPTASGDPCVFLIDGIHRFARAKRDGIAELMCVALSLEFTKTLQLDTDMMILDRLITDMMLAGAQVGFVGDKLIICGGCRIVEQPDDHPTRKRYIRSIYAGQPVDIPEAVKKMM